GTGVTFSGNTPSVTATFAANANSAQVRVSATNACGTSTVRSRNITVNPLPGAAGTISGPNTVCQGAGNNTFSITAVSNASGYTWTLPAGAVITSGANTRTITVKFADQGGDVVVTPFNACGNGTSSSKAVDITVCGAPDISTISGPDNVNINQTNVIYSVPLSEGTTYTWSVPAGATIVSGQGTNEIVVDFGVTGGEVTLEASNEFGTTTITKTIIVSGPTSAGIYADGIHISLYPNPSETTSILEINGNATDKIEVIIYQLNSNQVVDKLLLSGNDKMVIGENLNSGVYMIEVGKGKNKKILKWVKI
ncbi:MAG: T9SS type A sorting domain-containing protein, partial [Cytophagaceae bacterium]